MIDIITGEHHYQREILYPTDNAQEGIDYYEWTAEAIGNIADDLPGKVIDDIHDIVENWDDDKIDIIYYKGCVLRLTGDMCYIELTGGNVANLLDGDEIQEKIKDSEL